MRKERKRRDCSKSSKELLPFSILKETFSLLSIGYAAAAKKAPKDRASKEAEDALKRMEEDLSKEDLVSAHIERWTANGG